MADKSPVRSLRPKTAERNFEVEGPKRSARVKEIDDLDDEIRNRAKAAICKKENQLKLEALTDSSKRYSNGDINLEVKRPKLTTPTSPTINFESKYRTLENKIDEKRFKKEQEKINDNIPKKGTWRKEFAKFEDEMEIDNIRRENQKKLEMYANENVKENIDTLKTENSNTYKSWQKTKAPSPTKPETTDIILRITSPRYE